MSINLSRKDVVWSYTAQFISLASGLITLPLILRLLSTEEIAMNYLMITVGALVTLFDFGFVQQFGRNISYVFSGAQTLKKEGLEISDDDSEVNYRLLATMIHTARYVYRRIGAIVLVALLTLGSVYIYNATGGFTNIENSLVVWIVYSASVFFNIYYSYYYSLLTGKGLIAELNQAKVTMVVVKIVLTFVFLLGGMGLLGVALANLIAALAERFYCYRIFFTQEMRSKISDFVITVKEKRELFEVIWYNSKKLGLVFIGAYSITKLGMFLAGVYLSPDEVASYGLMMQLVTILTSLTQVLFRTYQPKFAELRVKNNVTLLMRNFAFTMNIFYVLYIVGIVFLIVGGPYLLRLIGSNAMLPHVNIMVIYSLVMFLEWNHSSFATFIVTSNDIPFVKSALIAGAAIGVGSFLSLEFTTLGILGLVLVQGLVQIVYANWKWPMVVCRDLNISFAQFVRLGFRESFYKLRTAL